MGNGTFGVLIVAVIVGFVVDVALGKGLKLPGWMTFPIALGLAIVVAIFGLYGQVILS
jgi:hypothetical protein